MDSFKPRTLPSGLEDVLITSSAGFFQLLIILSPALIAFVISNSLYLTGFIAAITGYATSLFNIEKLTLSKDGMSLKRDLGRPKHLTWKKITSIKPVTPKEFLLHGLLSPKFLAITAPSYTSFGQYRVDYDGGYFFFPPKDNSLFEEVIQKYSGPT